MNTIMNTIMIFTNIRIIIMYIIYIMTIQQYKNNHIKYIKPA